MDDVQQNPVRLGLIGAGRIGRHHAIALSHNVSTVRLSAVADLSSRSAHALAEEVHVPAASVDSMLHDPKIEAVVISASSTAHSELIQRAAAAGKAVFCEKPMAMSLAEADAAISACQRAGVPLQVGFNRRFCDDFVAAHQAILNGHIGTPQILRSLTRDPGPLTQPEAIPPWTIFTQTLIHDFDTILWLCPGASALEVHAFADALVAPEFKESGLLDTAVVTIQLSNGAIATAEANFSASYGYDVRAEAFGSAGMVTMGGPAATSMRLWTSHGVTGQTVRRDTDLMHTAYLAEFLAFSHSVRDRTPVVVGGSDARAALEIALAAISSVEQGTPVLVNSAHSEATR